MVQYCRFLFPSSLSLSLISLNFPMTATINREEALEGVCSSAVTIKLHYYYSLRQLILFQRERKTATTARFPPTNHLCLKLLLGAPTTIPFSNYLTPSFFLMTCNCESYV